MQDPEPTPVDRTTDFMSLCHDLRQYVTAGRLLADLPDEPQFDDEMRRRFVLIGRTLDLAESLLERGLQEVPSSGQVQLAALVRDCVDVARIRHPVQLEVLAEPGVITCDSLQLHRAVDNMLDNAIRAAGEGGLVKVRVGVEDGCSYVEVEDDGPGFANIRRSGGRGLSVVGSATRSCRGRLRIDSGPGPGTTVRITLPRDESGEPGQGRPRAR